MAIGSGVSGALFFSPFFMLVVGLAPVQASVFTLAVVAAVGAGIHALSAQPVWQVVGWSIPGVLIGSTIGSRVGKYLPAQTMEKGLGVVFGGVGILVLVLEFMV